MSEFRTRTLEKKMANAIRQSVKAGSVVERIEDTGDVMQVFYNNGNILKRTYRKDTGQWGSISICRNINWMGSYAWCVIQDSEGKDLRFGGDTSSFKVRPPFMLRDCECEVAEEHIVDEPVGETAEPEAPAEESEEDRKRKADAVMMVVRSVAMKHGMPENKVISKLASIQEVHRFKDINQAVEQFEKEFEEKEAERSADTLGMVRELLSGKPMWLDGIRLRMEAGVMYESRDGSAFRESSIALNDLLTSRMEYDDYDLTFEQATAIMEQSGWCRSEADGRMYTISKGRLEDSCGSAGIPLKIMESMWRVCKEE